MGNMKLLQEVKDNILRDPNSHNQETWFCDTSMCIAGHAAVSAGARVQACEMYSGSFEMVDQDGNLIFTPEFAQEKLDLTDEERTYLFYCMDNAVALKRIDQVLQTWEEGKVIDDLAYNDLILTEEGQEDPRWFD